MEIRHLRYFVTVARERNFTRAADKLHIAQPPLSRQIQQLEEEVGMVLLDRDSRPLRLTEAGRLLYEHAAQVLERFDDLRTMMRRFREAERPRYVIGFVASTIYAALPALIRRFRAETPGLDVSLVEMASLEQIAALKDGRIDVGFGRIRLDDPVVRRDVLREERLVVALPLSHPLLQREGSLSFAELAAEPLILYPRVPRPSYADQVISIFRDRGLEPHIAHEARELQTAIGLVAAEVGICIVPTSVQRLRRDDVVYRELIEQNITSPIIMSRRANDRSHESAVMARVVVEAYREWGWKIPEGLDS
jgi:LysR family transcriptional regulator, benzoate and cis,cis-muconate-responsive activator of ben and cat genes